MPRIRLTDVARAAGVSQGTASNAYNRPDLVRPELREAVLAAAARLGYGGPAPAGRALRRGRSNLIAVVSDEDAAYLLGDPHAQALLAGAATACDREGVGLTIASTGGERRGGWSVDTAAADGFILFCYEDETDVVARARRRGLPMVAVYAAGTEGVPTVTIDDRAAAEAAAAHLVGLGHRSFGVLSLDFTARGQSGPVDAERLSQARFSSTRLRLEGYGAALAAAGLSLEQAPVYETVNDAETAAAGVEWLLSRSERPTAILAMSDVIALAALEALRAAGVRVPEKMSLVGFDDAPEAARSTPPLSTVAQPTVEKGLVAAEMLLGLRPMADVRLPTELRVRGTTAPPATR